MLDPVSAAHGARSSSGGGVSARHRLCAALVIALTAVGGRYRLAAQDAERELGWFLTAEFAAVWTGGNSESNTLGLGATLRRVWQRSELRFDAKAIRTESSLKERTAVGTPSDFDLVVDERSETTANNTNVRGRYDYNVSERFFLFGGADWLRDRPAGIESRFLMVTGAGNLWVDNDRVRFKTDYGAAYTFQDDVIANPFIKTNFPGIRVSYDFAWTVSASTEFTSELIGDWNLDNTDDLRLGFTNSLPVAITGALSLKPSLKLAWRNEPSLTEVGLAASDGTPTGETVLVPLQKLDTFFTLALVVKF